MDLAWWLAMRYYAGATSPATTSPRDHDHESRPGHDRHKSRHHDRGA